MGVKDAERRVGTNRGVLSPTTATARTRPGAGRPPVVASVPAHLPYVRHLAAEHGPAHAQLIEPLDGPARMLDPCWVASADFDVYHLHTGYDACSPDQLRALVEVLRRRATPLVVTVHDLHRRPDPRLDVLVPGADAVVTLTPSAAAEIRARWGRDAQVVAHPHVVDLQAMAVAQDCRARRRTGALRIGLDLTHDHPGSEPLRILPTLLDTVRALPSVVLEVDARPELFRGPSPRPVAELASLLRTASGRGDLQLHLHEPLVGGELWAHLASLDVSVLPHGSGTHSWWLEACRDLGVTVVAPSCGYLAEQGPVLTYQHDEASYDADSLAAAIRHAHRERPQLGASIDERRAQRRAGAEAQARLYESLLDVSRSRPA